MVFTGKCKIGFNLPTNYHSYPESLLRKSHSRISSPGSFRSYVRETVDRFQGTSTLIEPVPMAPTAWKCINDFSASSSANVRIGPEMNVGDGHFELKLASEDANAHLQYFLVIYSAFTFRGVTQDAVHLCLFPFSLLRKGEAVVLRQ
jgi:hypothetical protein